MFATPHRIGTQEASMSPGTPYTPSFVLSDPRPVSSAAEHAARPPKIYDRESRRTLFWQLTSSVGGTTTI